VHVEISLMVQRRPGFDPVAAARQSYDVVARAFEAAGVPRTRRIRVQAPDQAPS